MTAQDKQIKNFNIRLPLDTWRFLKKASMEQERSMMEIIVECIEKYRKKVENKLTSDDTHV